MTVGIRPSLLEIATRAVDEKGAMQKPTELAAFLAVARSLDPVSVWEIGTATGGTLWALANVLSAGTTYLSVDLPGGAYGGNQSLAEGELADLLWNVALGPRVVSIRCDSQDVDVEEAVATAGAPQLLLIDGDHSEAGVRADWNRYAPLVSAGLVALHDILPHPSAPFIAVDRVWAEVVATEAWTVEIADRRPRDDGTQWGGFGIVLR